jgi:hypothetical protein
VRDIALRHQPQENEAAFVTPPRPEGELCAALEEFEKIPGIAVLSVIRSIEG